MRRLTVLCGLLAVTSAMADEASDEAGDDDLAFFEFLGSFEAEDEEWLDSQLRDELAAENEASADAESEEDH